MKHKKTLFFSLCCAMIAVTICSCGIKTAQKEEIIVDTAIPYISESELILRPDLICTGTVAEIKDSKWSNPDNVRGDESRNVLQTDIVIDADTFLYGEREDNQVIIRIDKGEDESTIVHCDAYPDFVPNEKVLLFLSRDDSDIATDEDYYVLTGMVQGAYILSDDGVTYICADKYNERTTTIPDLQVRIVSEHEANPSYKEELEQRKQEIIEENRRNFG